MLKLLVASGDKKGLVKWLDRQETLIGRDDTNGLPLPDTRASRTHAKITIEGSDYLLEDMESTNGTLVNGSLVTRHRLKAGDKIKIGSTMILCLAPGASEVLGQQDAMMQVKMQSAKETSDNFDVSMRISSDTSNTVFINREALEAADLKTIRQACRKLDFLYGISSKLASIQELSELLPHMLKLVVDGMKADRGVVLLVDRETGQLIPHAVHRKDANSDEIVVSHTIVAEVYGSGEAVLTSDAMTDKRFSEAQSVVLHGIRSAMYVPLKAKEEIMGVVCVDAKASQITFVRDDLELLVAICTQAGMALKNAMLFDDLRNANIVISERQQQLIESEKLSALGKLSSVVAHEISNPLTSIMGYADLLQETVADGLETKDDVEKCVEFVKILQNEAQRCQRIAQNLLQFARRRKAEKILLDINSVVEDTLVLAEYQIQKTRMTLVKELAATLPQVVADPGQLQQVFLNMIVNARDAMGAAGRLSISTSRAPDGFVDIRFSDTGCGISEEAMEDIFKPLFTTKPDGLGTGLGLSVSREIIEQHGGSIEVESTVSVGTAFTIRLPIAKEN